MFFKAQKKEYFTNCIALGIDYKSNFDINEVFDAQDVLLEKKDANEMAIKLSASYFLKNMKKIQKWKKTKSFEADCNDFECERQSIERYENSNFTTENPNDFLNTASEDDYYNKDNGATEERKEKYEGERHDFLDGD